MTKLAMKRSPIQLYPFIQAWHYTSGSLQYYVEDKITVACMEDAPWDAIYRNEMGYWVTIGSVANPDAVTRCREYISARMGNPDAQDPQFSELKARRA